MNAFEYTLLFISIFAPSFAYIVTHIDGWKEKWRG